MILEVGMGGRYDATNCLNHDWFGGGRRRGNVVCGITLLDYDHTRILGATLADIAWEKGGILLRNKLSTQFSPRPSSQSSSSSITIKKVDQTENDNATTSTPPRDNKASLPAPPPQRLTCYVLDSNPPEVLNVLQHCAHIEGQGAQLVLVGGSGAGNGHAKDGLGLPRRPPRIPPTISLGLAGAHQRHNAELAVALCEHIMMNRDEKQDDNDSDNEEEPHRPSLETVLSTITWPGRCQTVEWTSPPTEDANSNTNHPQSSLRMRFRLDGAHTLQSLQAGVTWFHEQQQQKQQQQNCQTCLIFNCSHERSPVELLQLLVPLGFSMVVFAYADSERPSAIAKGSAKEWLEQAGLEYRPNLGVKDVSSNHQKASNHPTITNTWQETLACLWTHLEWEHHAAGSVVGTPVVADATTPKTNTEMVASVNAAQAITWIQNTLRQQQSGNAFSGAEETAAEKTVEVFVTGSLYLVGSVLNAINWEEEDAPGEIQVSS